MENMSTLQQLEEQVLSFVPAQQHDVFAIEAIKEAISAAKNGNFGVGAILVDNESGEIAYRGQNKVFSESRSDLHAEMDLLDTFEVYNKGASRAMLQKYTLYTSLESCPMCLCRIITSGVPTVYHIADDEFGGMVHLFGQLPPVWQDIAKGRKFAKANCSSVLSKIAEQVFVATAGLDDKLASAT